METLNRRRALPKVHDEDEMIALARQPDPFTKEGPRDRAILSVLCACALRASELCNLRVKDVRSDLVFVRYGKFGAQRWVPISEPAYRRVRAYLEQYPAGPDDYLFRTGPNRKLTIRRLNKIVNRYARELELQTGVHVLRHSCATRLLNRGLNLEYLREFMGHVRLSTTSIYLKTATVELQRAYRAATAQKAA